MFISSCSDRETTWLCQGQLKRFINPSAIEKTSDFISTITVKKDFVTANIPDLYLEGEPIKIFNKLEEVPEIKKVPDDVIRSARVYKLNDEIHIENYPDRFRLHTISGQYYYFENYRDTVVSITSTSAGLCTKVL